MKKYWKEILLWTIMVVFIIPLWLAFLLRFDFIITVVSSDWILGKLFGWNYRRDGYFICAV